MDDGVHTTLAHCDLVGRRYLDTESLQDLGEVRSAPPTGGIPSLLSREPRPVAAQSAAADNIVETCVKLLVQHGIHESEDWLASSDQSIID